MRLEFYSVEKLGDAYKSNSELNYFSQQLAATENAMEIYVNYHTFESIDAYYSGRGKVDEFILSMRESPSTNELLQKEYIVNQLSKSFSYFSSKAIASRRANSEQDVIFFYNKTIDCYNLLLSHFLVALYLEMYNIFFH